MTSIEARLQGAFLGHAIASEFDGSGLLAMDFSDSLMQLQRFDGPRVLSKYLYTLHSKPCSLGEVMTLIYNDMRTRINKSRQATAVVEKDFIFNQNIIDEVVESVDTKLNGLTAACGPAHRSFPLALYSAIDDDDVFDFSLREARLTHANPIAGQASGIINVICRSLLREKSWHDAVASAFAMPNLHRDIREIYSTFARGNPQSEKGHPAYVPVALSSALQYVANERSFKDAIEAARANEKFQCVTIVGILAGVRWGVPSAMRKNLDQNQQTRLKSMINVARRFHELWSNGVEDTIF